MVTASGNSAASDGVKPLRLFDVVRVPYALNLQPAQRTIKYELGVLFLRFYPERHVRDTGAAKVLF